MSKRIQVLLSFFILATMVFMPGSSDARTRKYTADVVVIGVGGSGVSAAVSAAENGAKVIALEKQEIPGGSSNFAEGLLGVETTQTKRTFEPMTVDEMYKGSMHFNHGYRVNPKLVRKYIVESADTIKWLEGEGVHFHNTTISTHEPRVWHLIEDYKGATHGAALITRMVERADELGVKILYSTPATNIVVEDGVVKAVEAVDARGNKVIIETKSAIIATGGFPNSKEKIAKWTSFDPEKVFATVPLQKTGDGIQMGIDAGADTQGKFGLMLHVGTQGPGVKPLGSLLAMTWEPNLWVNKYGDRFIDETIVGDFSLAGNAVEAQRDSMAWSIFDSKKAKEVMEEGLDMGIGVLVPVGTKLTHLMEEIDETVKAGNPNFAEADSIEELAKKIGVEPVKLVASVKEFNGIKANHYDPTFVRDPKSIMTLEGPKYYAVKLQPFYFVSLGGLRVNTSMQVLNDNDQAIKGLYAAGCDVGGLYGDTYTLWASGSAYSFAATSGRISGKNAAEYAK
jgi:fumarate reductase flavoprotein subunit